MKGKAKPKKAMPKGLMTMRAAREGESMAKEKREMAMGKKPKRKGY